MPGFFLRPLQSVDRSGIAFLQEQEITAVIDDDDGDTDVAFFGFGFGAGDHGLDGGEVEVFFDRQVVAK